MRVLVIGAGGREHVIAWACERAGHDVTVAPGNAGTRQRVELDPLDPSAVVGWCATNQPDLVIVGPEAPLAAGLSDALNNAGIACFGPSRTAARLEWSKSHTRELAAQLGLPSPAHGTFGSSDADAAVAWWRALGRSVVVKQNGLAAGKGVVLPMGDDATEHAIRAFAHDGNFVLEERLSGPECSLLAFCDGRIAVPMPIAQDHKRIGEGDTGPNTGGMGAYAPAPVPYDAAELTATFIQPVIDHLAAVGTPFVGVLYAGLMLTADGPRLLEFNCRFGDPEAQAILPLLDSDLAAIAFACAQGSLTQDLVRWKSGAACAVVGAAARYPDTAAIGDVISCDEAQLSDQQLVFFAAATERPDGSRVTSGGRVLAVTGLGDDLAAARDAAYGALTHVSFNGMQVRRDIGWRAPGAMTRSYASAGVSIDEGNRAVSMLKEAVERTHTENVLGGIGAFGGGLDVTFLKSYERPVLVASTDGVGTKVELAARAGRPEVSGMDIVNHCIDDVLVQGARPLFFLDYIAASTLDSELVAAVVGGMAAACEASGCVLLGGETAEMPGVYMPGAFDVAGTLVGVVDRSMMLPRPGIAAGDVLIGLASSGPHTNGYSLLRKIFQWAALDAQPEPLDRPLVDALLTPHRSYLNVLSTVLEKDLALALAHITGGGLLENVPRILPEGTSAFIDTKSWPEPPLFQLVRQLAPNLPDSELYRTLNMGIGMVVVARADDVSAVQAAIDEETWVIGEVIAGDREVRLG
jgi:phosphoribosylamine--glycine ligase/phosphoribosylaminoimidazole synthetase